MAEKFNSEVHLLYVSSTLEHFTSIYVPHPSIDRFEKEIGKEPIKKWKNMLKVSLITLNCRFRLSGLGPGWEIVNCWANSIDLAIVGTHEGRERMIYGSVARSVFERSKIPVMIINPYMLQELGAENTWKVLFYLLHPCQRRKRIPIYLRYVRRSAHYQKRFCCQIAPLRGILQ